MKRELPRLHVITDERIARRADLAEILAALTDIPLAAHARGRFSYTWQQSRHVESGDALTNSPRHLAKLALTVPLIWLPLLLFIATMPWLFLVIGFLSPPVLLFFYELVVRSQAVFGEVVMVAIVYFLPGQGIRSQASGIRSQESGVRSQESGVTSEL